MDALQYLNTKLSLLDISQEIDKISLYEDNNRRSLQFLKIKSQLEELKKTITNVPPLKYPALPKLD